MTPLFVLKKLLPLRRIGGFTALMNWLPISAYFETVRCAIQSNGVVVFFPGGSRGTPIRRSVTPIAPHGELATHMTGTSEKCRKGKWAPSLLCASTSVQQQTNESATRCYAVRRTACDWQVVKCGLSLDGGVAPWAAERSLDEGEL